MSQLPKRLTVTQKKDFAHIVEMGLDLHKVGSCHIGKTDLLNIRHCLDDNKPTIEIDDLASGVSHTWRMVELLDSTNFVCRYDKISSSTDKPSNKTTNNFQSKARRIMHGAKSTLQTQVLRMHRATDDEFKARLAVCENCEFSTRKKSGELHSCGPMLQELRNQGKKTCGCILKNKARDRREDCPNNYWPTINETADKTTPQKPPGAGGHPDADGGGS